MAIYHLEAKIISRGAGRSACAATAYMSCSRIYNDYDGVQHDYTRKQGLVWQRVFLPAMAPPEWQNRERLWNAVEEQEKTKDSRLAREFVAALPVELDKDAWVKLLSEFIQEQFVADGMCADVAIHDTDGHNPHAHIMLTVRPLTDKGTWQHKTEKEYLCVRDGAEQGFTAAEFKAAQAEGWEKQYQYKADKKKVYMTAVEAEAHGYERVSKYPKCTKFGRQNPISARWNSEEQLVVWRAAWADTVNRALEQAGREERIDHRSHAERGFEEQPTVHEGVETRIMERKGVVSDRAALNRQIKADNMLLRELKAVVAKLSKALQNTIPAIAKAMETIRQNMIVLRYGALHYQYCRTDAEAYLAKAKPAYNNYLELRHTIQAKIEERKEVQWQRDETPVRNFLKRRELSAKISSLTEELEDLRNEEAFIVQGIDKDAAGMKNLKTDIANTEAVVQRYVDTERKFTEELDQEKQKFAELKHQANELDQDELIAARLAIRPEMEQKAEFEIQHTITKEINSWTIQDSILGVDHSLGEVRLEETFRHRQQQKLRQQNKQNKRKHRSREWER